MPIKSPARSDYTVEVSDAAVIVTFILTTSVFRFLRLAPEEVEKHGPLGSDCIVRHSRPSGDTGDYPSEDVASMAQIALGAVSRR